MGDRATHRMKDNWAWQALRMTGLLKGKQKNSHLTGK
jgi:hypothetical protein